MQELLNADTDEVGRKKPTTLYILHNSTLYRIASVPPLQHYVLEQEFERERSAQPDVLYGEKSELCPWKDIVINIERSCYHRIHTSPLDSPYHMLLMCPEPLILPLVHMYIR